SELEGLVQQIGKTSEREGVEAVLVEVGIQVDLINVHAEHGGCRLQEGVLQAADGLAVAWFPARQGAGREPCVQLVDAGRCRVQARPSCRAKASLKAQPAA